MALYLEKAPEGDMIKTMKYKIFYIISFLIKIKIINLL